MNVFTEPPEIPMGFGMALAANPESMESFAQMTNEQKRAVIERTHGIDSKTEMEDFVRYLSAE